MFTNNTLLNSADYVLFHRNHYNIITRVTHLLPLEISFGILCNKWLNIVCRFLQRIVEVIWVGHKKCKELYNSLRTKTALATNNKKLQQTKLIKEGTFFTNYTT